MDPEVPRDLLDRHTRTSITSDPDDVLTELFGEGLGHSDILSARPAVKRTQVSQIGSSAPYASSGPE